MRFAPLLILVFLLTVIGFSTVKISQIKHSNKEAQKNFEEDFGVKFREFSLVLPEFELDELFNKKAKLTKKDLIGEYALVNFFASWCTTCIAEHEILLRIKNENLLPIYGIAWRDINGETKKFLKKRGNPYRKVGIDSKGLFSKIAAVNAIPETWIVDSKGKVARKITGNLQDFSIEEIRNFLRENQKKDSE